MFTQLISVLEVEILNLEKSALKNPPDTNLEFHFGKKVGERNGLQKALDAIQRVIAENDKAHEIKR